MRATTETTALPRRRPTYRALGAAKAALVLALTAGLLHAPPPAAQAQDFRLHLEGAAALWVDSPQSDRFTPGLYLAVRPGLALGRVVSLQWSYAMLLTPAAEGFTEDGVAHFVTAGVRVRPLAFATDPEDQLGGLFLDFNLGYVRTGDLDRFGFDAGLGYNFQAAPWLALGPVVRYGHIVQPNDTPDVDPNDGQFLTFGLNASFGPAYEEEEEVVCGRTHEECVRETPPPQDPRLCLDRDGDGLCDDEDRCPTVAGPISNYGCPTFDPCTGEPLVVVVQFEQDSAVLPPPQDGVPQTMDPVLEAVAAAIAQNPTCRVCIAGYASEEGGVEHNRELSQRRAGAVQGYLAARGVDRERLPTTGFGASCQLVPESSRILNRRVEFRRLDEGESCPTRCSQ